MLYFLLVIFAYGTCCYALTAAAAEESERR